MKKKTLSRINTDTQLISTLIAGIKKGEIKIPQFQRKFVWKDEQALDLVDRIANNSPVGSLLLWRTKEKLRVERNIGEFRLPATCTVLIIMAFFRLLRTFREICHGKRIGNAL